MIEMFLLALLVAKIKKYKLAPMFKEWTTYLILAYALIYLVINFMAFKGSGDIIKYAGLMKVMYISIFVIMIIKYSLYKAGFLGTAFIVAGGILNSIVMKANGGKMPVYPSFSYITGYVKPDTYEKIMKYDNVHVMGSSSTKLAFLSDYIDLGYTILAIGDVFIIFIMFLLTYGMIKKLNSK